MNAVLRQAIYVGFARTEIAALYRVIKQAVNTVAIVLIILCRIDAALRRDTVRTPRAPMKAEALHVVTQPPKGSRARSPRQAGAYDDHVVLPLVGRVHQLHLKAGAFPGSFYRS